MALNQSQRLAFAAALRQCIESRQDLTCDTLARVVRCDRSYVHNLCRGAANPSASFFLQLANALGVPPEQLLPAEDQPALHGWGGKFNKAGRRKDDGTDAEPPCARERPASAADRMDADLTLRRLAAALLTALAVAEDTIEAIRSPAYRGIEWGRQLMAVDAALREAGVKSVELYEAAAELGGAS